MDFDRPVWTHRLVDRPSNGDHSRELTAIYATLPIIGRLRFRPRAISDGRQRIQ
jgi:hypothetical protein